MKKYIYKICTNIEWNNALLKQVYCGSEVDIRDKYIHFSSAEQVQETLRLHFFKKNKFIFIKSIH